MNINEYQVLLIGKANLEPKSAEKIQYGKDVQIRVVGSLLKTEEIDNQDGTLDKILKIKITGAELYNA